MLEIVLGPARSGKAERGLARFYESLGPRGQSQALWIVQNRNLARTLRVRATQKLGALTDLKILTLDDFARSVFHESSCGKEVASDFTRTLLLSQLLDKTKDPTLKEAKKKTDFVLPLAQAIHDLKEHLLWPQEAPRIFANEYEKYLETHHLVDRKSMVSQAIRFLSKEKNFWRASNIQQVLIYGFTSFSPLEWKLIEVILNHVPGWISLTADSTRPEIFNESLNTLKKLKSQFKVKQVEEIAVNEKPPTVRLIQSSNSDSECEWIARECVQLIQKEKIAPHQIAIISGAGGGSAWWHRQIFNRYGLRLHSFCAEKITSSPLIKKVESLLKKENLPEKTTGKKIYDFIMTHFQEKGDWEKVLNSSDVEAQIHFAAFRQWVSLLQEMDGLPLFKKEGLELLRHLSFRLPGSPKSAIHFYGGEAPPLESYSVVFIPHFLENSFPRPIPNNLFRPQPLISEEEHRYKERLSFYHMVTRASKKLYLLAPQKSALGQEELPSNYSKEWGRFFPGATLPEWEKVGLLTPKLDQTPFEAVATEMENFFHRKKQSQLKDELILNQLKESLSRSTSITQLESFGKCHYQHFANHILKLQDEEADKWFRIRGQIAHEVLASVGSELKELDLPTLLQKVEEKTDQEFEKLSLPLTKANLELEKRDLKSMLVAFLKQERVRLEKSGDKPTLFEKPFGQDGVDFYRLKVSEELVLPFRGRIDRVDTSNEENVIVLDYKSGGLPAPKGMKEGTNLQIAFYLDVCEKVFGLNPIEGFYLSLKDGKLTGIKYKYLRDRLNEMKTHLKNHAKGILSGSIKASADIEFCRSCSFRFGCRTYEGN